MKFKILPLILASAFAVSGSAVGQSSPTPYEIDGILPLTGPQTFSGRAELQTLQIIEASVNKSGGIGGRPIHFVISDDQSSPQTTVQLTNELIAKQVPLIMGTSSTANCLAQMPLVAKDGPVTYCLSPGVRPPEGGYVFSASVFAADLASVFIRYFRLRGWNRIAIITSTDASGQTMEHYFDQVLTQPENKGVVVVDHEHFAPLDLSVAAQLERIKAANPQAVITWTTGTPFGTVLRGIKDAGIDVPIGGGNGNMTYAQMTQYVNIIPKQLFFPGQAGVNTLLGQGAWRTAQVAYFNAFKAAGVRPDLANSQAWDPALLFIDALKHAGLSANAAQLHGYIENLHDWPGVYGVYDFRDGSQRGIGQNATIMYTWDTGKADFAVASKPAGYLLR
jgi:branched-chain amino acid transport system substrate-binding protein